VIEGRLERWAAEESALLVDLAPPSPAACTAEFCSELTAQVQMASSGKRPAIGFAVKLATPAGGRC